MRRALFRWNFALRLARRGVTRSLGRSVLIVVLIALPMAALSGAALLRQSDIRLFAVEGVVRRSPG